MRTVPARLVRRLCVALFLALGPAIPLAAGEIDHEAVVEKIRSQRPLDPEEQRYVRRIKRSRGWSDEEVADHLETVREAAERHARMRDRAATGMEWSDVITPGPDETSGGWRRGVLLFGVLPVLLGAMVLLFQRVFRRWRAEQRLRRDLDSARSVSELLAPREEDPPETDPGTNPPRKSS